MSDFGIQQPRMNPLPRYVSFTAEQLRARDAEIRKAAVASTLDYLQERGQLLPEGKPVTVRTVERDEKGQITAIVEEQVIARERDATRLHTRNDGAP